MKVFIGAAIGAAIGFTIGYLGKCASGACPLTNNPAITAAIGALIGAMLAASR